MKREEEKQLEKASRVEDLKDKRKSFLLRRYDSIPDTEKIPLLEYLTQDRRYQFLSNVVDDIYNKLVLDSAIA